MYNPIDYIIKNNTNIKLKIFYFSLEMSKEQKLRQSICNQLYVKSKGKYKVDPKSLRSVKNPISEEILKEVDGLEDHFNKFQEVVTFIDNIKNPTGIYKFMRDYAQSNGTVHMTEKIFKDNKTGEEYKNKIFDYYEPNNPDEYVIMIIDHVSLLHQEQGMNLHQTITKLSSNYLVELRNRYNFIPVVIQQQSAAQESVENMKANRLKPSLDGLADNKLTARDADIVLGLFSPYRHKIKTYPEKDGYNTMYFKDNIRFLEVLASREGGGNSLCPLYFDGAVNFFKELPLPNDIAGMTKIKKFILNERNR